MVAGNEFWILLGLQVLVLLFVISIRAHQWGAWNVLQTQAGIRDERHAELIRQLDKLEKEIRSLRRDLPPPPRRDWDD